MSLQFIAEPVGAPEIVAKILGRLLSHPNYLAGLRLQDSTTLQRKPQNDTYAPLAVYGMNVAKLASGGGLEVAHPRGFGYVIEADGKPVGYLQLGFQDIKNQTGLKFSSVGFGDKAKEIVQALKGLANSDQVRNGSYEARILQAGAASLLAIWLKPLDGGDDDLLHPVGKMGDNPLASQAEPPYLGDEFIEALRPHAQRAINQARAMAAGKADGPSLP